MATSTSPPRILRVLKVSLWILRDTLTYWRTVVLILAPIVLSPLPAVFNSREARCAYVIILTATYWVAEVAPLPVTALMPIFLFPLLHVLDAKETCKQYLRDTNFIFIAGLIMAVALEESNLHTRIALRVLLWMGDEPRWLTLGFMGTTAFLSMWMSNTAATAMMVPIAIVILEILIRHAVLDMLEQQSANRAGGSIIEQTPPPGSKVQGLPKGKELAQSPSPLHVKIESSASSPKREGDLAPSKDSSIIVADKVQTIPDFDDLPKHLRGLCRATLLSIAYGASLGGTATLTGTGPNLVFLDRVQKRNPTQTTLSFGTWIAACTPSMILCVFLGWAWLVIYFMGWRSLFLGCCRRKKSGKTTHVQKALRARYEDLGKISFAEGSIIFWLIVLILLWVLRDPVFVPGWSQLLKLKKGYSSDACAGMLIAFILFVFPNEKPDFICFRRDKNMKPKLRKSLIAWSHMQNKFPWSIIVLLGGGFALAEGSQKSGLSKLITISLTRTLNEMPPIAVVTLIVTMVTFFTEVASNSATASIFTPIVLSVAESLCANPFYFGIPSTLAASFAFMLPVATVPNAIVYETRLVKLSEMVIAGFGMNLLCIAVTLLSIHSWTYAIFNLGEVPEWARKNETGHC